MATSCEELTHWKRLWCCEGLGAGGEGDDRGWDGWMASLTWWTWVWVNSGSWWWTGRPGVLRFMGSQRVRHDWVTDLIWLWLCNYYSLNTTISRLIIRKIIELYHQSYNLIEKPVITFKNPDAFQNYPETFLKNTNAQVLLFFLQSSRYVSNEQSCLKTTGLYDDLLLLSNLFHFFYFMFNDPILFSLCSLISPSFFFWCSF